MDFKKLSTDELINYCKDNNIDYINKKSNKPFTRNTLLNKLVHNPLPMNDTNQNSPDNQETNEIQYLNQIIWKTDIQCDQFTYKYFKSHIDE